MARKRTRTHRRNSTQTAEFHAQPYAGGRGFYFDTVEDWGKGMAALNKKGIEEVEVQFISGDAEDATLANELLSTGTLGQHNVERWYEDIEDLGEHEKAALYFTVAHLGEHDLDAALSKVEDEVRPQEGEAKEAVEDFVSDMGGPAELGAETLAMYFDYESYARDMGFNGELHEFTFAGKPWTIIGTF